MITLFAAEVGSMLWILIGTSLLRSGLSLAFIRIFIVKDADL